MEQLKRLDSLVIREKKEYPGVPATWKMKPACCLENVSGEELYYVIPEKGLSLGFDVLKISRTFTIYLVSRKGEEILSFVKKFSLFDNKMEIFDSNENLLGSVHKHTGRSKNSFQVLDAANRTLYDIEGPLESPEVFHIHKNGVVVGKISQKWAGTIEKGTFKSSHFGMVFPLGAEVEEKGVLVGALFLIDFLF